MNIKKHLAWAKKCTESGVWDHRARGILLKETGAAKQREAAQFSAGATGVKSQPVAACGREISGECPPTQFTNKQTKLLTLSRSV